MRQSKYFDSELDLPMRALEKQYTDTVNKLAGTGKRPPYARAPAEPLCARIGAAMNICSAPARKPYQGRDTI